MAACFAHLASVFFRLLVTKAINCESPGVKFRTPLEMAVPITDYQMAPSKRGAGEGSATHKEPT